MCLKSNSIISSSITWKSSNPTIDSSGYTLRFSLKKLLIKHFSSKLLKFCCNAIESFICSVINNLRTPPLLSKTNPPRVKCHYNVVRNNILFTLKVTLQWQNKFLHPWRWVFIIPVNLNSILSIGEKESGFYNHIQNNQ